MRESTITERPIVAGLKRAEAALPEGGRGPGELPPGDLAPPRPGGPEKRRAVVAGSRHLMQMHLRAWRCPSSRTDTHRWTLDSGSRTVPRVARARLYSGHGAGVRRLIFDLPEDYVLSNAEVHCWHTRLGSFSPVSRSFSDILSAEEKERTENLRSVPDRVRYVVGRVMVRVLVGKLLGIRPAELLLQLEASGRPIVSHEINTRDVKFSISHSGAFVLVAVARGRSVGIDVERIPESFEFEHIAARFFSPRERAELTEVPLPERLDAFFRFWCRKEAFVKAQGAGLLYPLDQFDVSVAPGEAVSLLGAGAEQAEGRRWQIRDLDVGRGYAAALAAEGPDFTLKSWGVEVSHCSE